MSGRHAEIRPTAASSEAQNPRRGTTLPLARAQSRRRARPTRRSRPREFARESNAHSRSRTDPPPRRPSIPRPTPASDPRDVTMGTSRATNASERLDASKMRRAGKPSARTGAPTMAKLADAEARQKNILRPLVRARAPTRTRPTTPVRVFHPSRAAPRPPAHPRRAPPPSHISRAPPSFLPPRPSLRPTRATTPRRAWSNSFRVRWTTFSASRRRTLGWRRLRGRRSRTSRRRSNASAPPSPPSRTR